MSWTDVMGGSLGQVNNYFQNNLANNAALTQATAPQSNPYAAYSAAMSPASLYSGGSFGAATDYYSQLAAQYGLATGGFNAAPAAAPAASAWDAWGGGGGYTSPDYGSYNVPTPAPAAPAWDAWGGGGGYTSPDYGSYNIPAAPSWDAWGGSSYAPAYQSPQSQVQPSWNTLGDASWYPQGYAQQPAAQPAWDAWGGGGGYTSPDYGSYNVPAQPAATPWDAWGGAGAYTAPSYGGATQPWDAWGGASPYGSQATQPVPDYSAYYNNLLGGQGGGFGGGSYFDPNTWGALGYGVPAQTQPTGQDTSSYRQQLIASGLSPDYVDNWLQGSTSGGASASSWYSPSGAPTTPFTPQSGAPDMQSMFGYNPYAAVQSSGATGDPWGAAAYGGGYGDNNTGGASWAPNYGGQFADPGSALSSWASSFGQPPAASPTFPDQFGGQQLGDWFTGVTNNAAADPWGANTSPYGASPAQAYPIGGSSWYPSGGTPQQDPGNAAALSGGISSDYRQQLINSGLSPDYVDNWLKQGSAFNSYGQSGGGGVGSDSGMSPWFGNPSIYDSVGANPSFVQPPQPNAGFYNGMMGGYGGLGGAGNYFDPSTFAPMMNQGGVDPASGQSLWGGTSPANNYSTFQQQSFLPPWQASIPSGFNSPDVVNAVNQQASQLGVDPAAFAAMIQMESGWDPRNVTGQYAGMTQMGKSTFDEAGGTLGGLTWDQYKNGTAAQQIGAYGDWLSHYAANSPNSAASLVSGGIGSLPPEMQAAIMQGTQFGPNKVIWPSALGQGNMGMPVSSGQASALGNTSIGAMNDAFSGMMGSWPQQQLYSNYYGGMGGV